MQPDKLKEISISTHIDDQERQRNVIDSIDNLTKLAKAHISNMYMIESDIINYKSKCLLSISNADYESPTKAQVQQVVDYLTQDMGIDKAQIARELGVSPIKNRRLNYWLSDSSDSTIPYAAWRLLLSMAGLSIDLKLFPRTVKDKILRK